MVLKSRPNDLPKLCECVTIMESRLSCGVGQFYMGNPSLTLMVASCKEKEYEEFSFTLRSCSCGWVNNTASGQYIPAEAITAAKEVGHD